MRRRGGFVVGLVAVGVGIIVLAVAPALASPFGQPRWDFGPS